MSHANREFEGLMRSLRIWQLVVEIGGSYPRSGAVAYTGDQICKKARETFFLELAASVREVCKSIEDCVIEFVKMCMCAMERGANSELLDWMLAMRRQFEREGAILLDSDVFTLIALEVFNPWSEEKKEEAR